jgi:uncharacterized membrane protein
MDYLTLKWLHVLFSTVLFGTGIGSAFYFLAAARQAEPRVVAFVAARVVLADWLFTTPMIVLQPLTGAWLVQRAGLSYESRWLQAAIALYVVAVACWIPVVVLQLRMRDLAREAVTADRPLPPAFRGLLFGWIALGGVAFVALVAIFHLMVAKPA